MTETRPSFFRRAVNEAKRRLQSDMLIKKDLIAKYIPENAIIIEAGAHIGVDTVEMARMWPKATIYAFEPVPEIFAQLQKNVSKLKNVHIFDYALGTATGESEMFVSSGGSDGSSSLLKPKEHLVDHPEVKFDEKITVKTITVNDFAKQQNIKKIDFLWLDLQGYELKVLKSAVDFIPQISAIYTEVPLKETYEGTSQFREIRNWLKNNNFFVKVKKTRLLDMGNVLFVRKEIN